MTMCFFVRMREFWDTHLSVWGVTQPTPTLPPVDYSFQYALLTVTDDGSNPSQLNRFWMAMVSQTKLARRAME